MIGRVEAQDRRRAGGQQLRGLHGDDLVEAVGGLARDDGGGDAAQGTLFGGQTLSLPPHPVQVAFAHHDGDAEHDERGRGNDQRGRSLGPGTGGAAHQRDDVGHDAGQEVGGGRGRLEEVRGEDDDVEQACPGGRASPAAQRDGDGDGPHPGHRREMDEPGGQPAIVQAQPRDGAPQAPCHAHRHDRAAGDLRGGQGERHRDDAERRNHPHNRPGMAGDRALLPPDLAGGADSSDRSFHCPGHREGVHRRAPTTGLIGARRGVP